MDSAGPSRCLLLLVLVLGAHAQDALTKIGTTASVSQQQARRFKTTLQYTGYNRHRKELPRLYHPRQHEPEGPHSFKRPSYDSSNSPHEDPHARQYKGHHYGPDPDSKYHDRDMYGSYQDYRGFGSVRPSYEQIAGGDNGTQDNNWPSFDSVSCITGLTEYAEAFNQGGVAGCVDDDIIVRIDQDFLPLAATTKDAFFKNFIGARQKSASFWSYGDNPEKYKRIGRDMTLGNFVNNPPISRTGLQNGSFPGIRDIKNFVALLEAVGYGSDSTNPKRAYMMTITRKPTNRTAPNYIPTWPNVATYFSWYIRNVAAKDPAALLAADISDATPYKSFMFLPSTVKWLRNTTFADLTGCQAQCSVQDTNFGNAGDKNWTSPSVNVPRLSGVSCDTSRHPPPRYELTAPTIIDHSDNFCANDTTRPYMKYRQILLDGRCGNGAQNVTENRALSLIMAREYLAAPTDLIKAIVFRTYLLSRCSGNFNPLFSGDGFTYTGNGGFLGATGYEFHTGEVLREEVPKVFPSMRLVFFCPYNQDGTPRPHAICPESMGQFNAETFKQELQATNWDIMEVKHPLE